jgi:hypothetical protein
MRLLTLLPLPLLLLLCIADTGFTETTQARKHGIPLHVDVDLTFGSEAAVLPRGTSRKKMAALIGYVFMLYTTSEVRNYHYTTAAAVNQPVAARGRNVRTVSFEVDQCIAGQCRTSLNCS